jgi:uncharacterized protein YbjT (DUF2867 family)
MFAITGITGQVGGATARNLLDNGHQVRAILRDQSKAQLWRDRGCDIAIADLGDTASLTQALLGVEGVFILLPPTFDPTPGFLEARRTIASIRAAIVAAQPPKIVVLSTIGAESTRPNLLNQLGILEEELSALNIPIAFVRAAWFLENYLWDIAPARETGTVPSFLQPLDKHFPMVATEDIGRVAARLLTESWAGRRIVNLEGPARISPNEIANIFSDLLDKPVHMQTVPPHQWESIFRSQGMKNPTPRIQMLEGFNAGWIEFEGGQTASEKGIVNATAVLGDLLQHTQ